MARIFPDKPLEGTKSNAERKVFYALKDLLSDNYTIFHSVPMYRESRVTGKLLDGESDFIVAHPKKGLIVIEVKGGGISLNSESGSWTSIDSDGIRHEIKNPFEQAKYYKYLLADDLQGHPSTKKFSYPVGHAVWFPDLDLRTCNLGISIQLQKILLDAFSLEDASDAITQLFEESLGTKKQKIPSIAGIEALVKYLAPSWEISSTLAARFAGEERKIITATKSQFKVISLLDRVPKALISGSAGTGKTLLALEKARLLSIDNKNVLLLCFNKKLAKWLSNCVSNYSMVEVFHFHGLCTSFCQLADLPLQLPDPQSDQEIFFQYDLPELLMDAVEIIGKKYDAIIVDEGQDFSPHWWIPLQELLKPSDKETFYIFFDDNQVIYNNNLDFPFLDPLFTLTENCRNTKLIHNRVMNFYQGKLSPYAIGPDGVKPEIILVSNNIDVKLAVDQVIKRLVHKEGINPKSIVILSPLNAKNSLLEEGHKIGSLSLSWGNNENQYIQCSTVHSFKGLESPVVIFVELGSAHKQTRSELLYIGMSRARNHLILIALEEEKSILDSLGEN